MNLARYGIYRCNRANASLYWESSMPKIRSPVPTYCTFIDTFTLVGHSTEVTGLSPYDAYQGMGRGNGQIDCIDQISTQ